MKPYYIYPTFNNNGQVIKTHLTKVSFDGSVTTFCLPNIPCIVHDYDCCSMKGCCCDGHDVTEEDLKVWDIYFNEVTCQTCLKKARGSDNTKCNSQKALELKI